MRVDAVVSKADFIDQCRGKRVNFAESQAAVAVVLVAGGKTTTIEFIGEWRRSKDRLIFVAEAAEVVVLIGETVINPNIEVVLVGPLLRIAQKIVATKIDVRCGVRVESGQRGRGRINCVWTGCRKDVGRQRAVRADRKSAHSGGIVSANGTGLRQASIKDFSLIGLISVAVENGCATRGIGDRAAEIQEA